MKALVQLVKVIREKSGRRAWNLSDLRRGIRRISGGFEAIQREARDAPSHFTAIKRSKQCES
jgi:hypothetical protein